MTFRDEPLLSNMLRLLNRTSSIGKGSEYVRNRTYSLPLKVWYKRGISTPSVCAILSVKSNFMCNISAPKSLLAPVKPENVQTLASLLGDSYVITFVHDFEKAARHLRNDSYDLVVCGAHFDDSRSIELLQLARETANCQSIPFIIIRLIPQPLSPALNSSINLAVKQLGRATYLDLADFIYNPTEMRQLIEHATDRLLERFDVSSSLAQTQ